LKGAFRQNKKVSDCPDVEDLQGCTDLPPLIEKGSAVVLEIIPVVEMSFLIEVVVDGGVN
jgi:hypothetical protein